LFGSGEELFLVPEGGWAVMEEVRQVVVVEEEEEGAEAGI